MGDGCGNDLAASQQKVRAKRIRATSAESAIKAMVDVALGPPAVPAHVRLRKGDEPFWAGIMRARAYDEWTDADLVVAAQLARCQRDIEVESARSKGRSRGMSSRVTSLGQLIRLQMALMRTLRMGGQMAGDRRNEAGRRAAQHQAERVRTDLQDEEYIAV